MMDWRPRVARQGSPMRFLTLRGLAVALIAAVVLHGGPAAAQEYSPPPPETAQQPAPLAPETATDVRVSWEVRNRFRLFRDEKDFTRHLAATSGRRSSPPSRRWRRRRTAAAGPATW